MPSTKRGWSPGDEDEDVEGSNKQVVVPSRVDEVSRSEEGEVSQMEFLELEKLLREKLIAIFSKSSASEADKQKLKADIFKKKWPTTAYSVTPEMPSTQDDLDTLELNLQSIINETKEDLERLEQQKDEEKK